MQRTWRQNVATLHMGLRVIKGNTVTGIILYMRPANKRRRYIVMSSLIGWAHAHNGPCSQWVNALRFENLLATISSLTTFISNMKKKENLLAWQENFEARIIFLPAEGLGPALNAKTGKSEHHGWLWWQNSLLSAWDDIIIDCSQSHCSVLVTECILHMPCWAGVIKWVQEAPREEALLAVHHYDTPWYCTMSHLMFMTLLISL